MRMTSKPEMKLHARLARNGIRVFKLYIAGSYGCQTNVFIHGNKSTEEWRSDVRAFLESERNSVKKGRSATDGWHGESTIPSRLYQHLRSLGYCDIDDVVSDIYEGAVTVQQARIVDSPVHKEQETGFGHYGWESKHTDEPEDDQHDPRR